MVVVFFLQLLKQNSFVKYGYSFFLVWTGVALSLVTTVIFWAAYFTLKGYYQKKLRPKTYANHYGTHEREHYHQNDIDNITYFIQRPKKVERWRDVQISPGDNIRNYYLDSREPSYADSNGQLYQVPSRSHHSPYDYFAAYQNIYGSNGAYPH